ncbi:uncharacterized protein LOC104265575 [Ciona intestinalis]
MLFPFYMTISCNENYMSYVNSKAEATNLNLEPNSFNRLQNRNNAFDVIYTEKQICHRKYLFTRPCMLNINRNDSVNIASIKMPRNHGRNRCLKEESECAENEGPSRRNRSGSDSDCKQDPIKHPGNRLKRKELRGNNDCRRNRRERSKQEYNCKENEIKCRREQSDPEYTDEFTDEEEERLCRKGRRKRRRTTEEEKEGPCKTVSFDPECKEDSLDEEEES